MLGIVFALFYTAYLCVFKGMAMAPTYLQTTHFLFWWYVIWTVVLGALMVIVCLALTLGGGAIGQNYGPIGFLLGLGSGGALSLPLMFGFVIRRGLYVGGAYLLSTALVLQGGVAEQTATYEWNPTKLVLGALFLLVALLTRSKGSSSSSSKKS